MVKTSNNDEKMDDLVKFREDHFVPLDSDPKRQNLLKKIIQVTEAEYDWIRQVKLMLSTKNFSSEMDNELKELENSMRPQKICLFILLEKIVPLFSQKRLKKITMYFQPFIKSSHKSKKYFKNIWIFQNHSKTV